LGRLPAQANTWMPLLHTVVSLAFAQPDVLSVCTADAGATRLATTPPQDGPTSPLGGLLGRSDRSTAPPLQKSRKRMPVASRNAT
jgi:hypothetical protein